MPPRGAGDRDERADWYENLGGGSFGSGQTLGLVVGGGADAAELDGDGALDVGAGSVAFLNRGGGSFEGPVGVAKSRVTSVGTLDVDSDGDADVLSGSGIALRVHVNTLGADTDGDGLLDTAEVCLAGTDRTLLDTDGGGAWDSQELLDLTDPTDRWMIGRRWTPTATACLIGWRPLGTAPIPSIRIPTETG